jgi:hypothetical protein
MSVNIDKDKLISSFMRNKDVDLKVDTDQLRWCDLVVGDNDVITRHVYADKSIRALYVGPEGVTTGGAYLSARNRRPYWVQGVYTCYWVEIAVARSTSDMRLWKTVAGTPTTLGSEAVDLNAWDFWDVILSCSGTTIKVFRQTGCEEPEETPAEGSLKINVTDTAIDSGVLMASDVLRCYHPGHGTNAIPYLSAQWVYHHRCWIMPPQSPEALEPIAYFEVPVVGSGKIPKDSLGNPRPVGIEEYLADPSIVDPFRVELPQELVEIPKPIPKQMQNRLDLLRKHLPEEAIRALMPEAFPVERINRLAITHSALIPTDSKGQPVDNIAIVRVYQSTPEYCHPIEKRIQAIKEMRGVRQLSREEAIDLALKYDDKLHIHDLVPCTKHDLGGKCFQEYRDWRIHTIGDKPEFADTDVRKRYVKEPKGW